MGYEIARAGREMGFRVTLISGPTALPRPKGFRFVSVVSAEDMKRAVVKCWPRTDALVMTAAVCDYTPLRYSPSKIKRIKQRSVRFRRTADILESVGKQKGNRVLVGFALETEAVERNARRKLLAKNLDLIAANWYSSANNPFGDRRISMMLIARDGSEKLLERVSKKKTARAILREVAQLLARKKC